MVKHRLGQIRHDDRVLSPEIGKILLILLSILVVSFSWMYNLKTFYTIIQLCKRSRAGTDRILTFLSLTLRDVGSFLL